MTGWECLRLLTISERLRFESNFEIFGPYNYNLTTYYDRTFVESGDFVGFAFLWSDTPEGTDYWYDIWKRVRNVRTFNGDLVKFKQYEKKIMV